MPAFAVETIVVENVTRDGYVVFIVKLPYCFDGRVVVSLARHEAGDPEA